MKNKNFQNIELLKYSISNFKYMYKKTIFNISKFAAKKKFILFSYMLKNIFQLLITKIWSNKIN